MLFPGWEGTSNFADRAADNRSALAAPSASRHRGVNELKVPISTPALEAMRRSLEEALKLQTVGHGRRQLS